MKRIFITALILLLALPAYAVKKKPVIKPLTEEQKTFYAIGLVMAKQLEVFELTPAELRLVKRGLNDATRGKKIKVDFATYSKKSQELAIARRDAYGKKLALKTPVFMAHEAVREGAITSKSGMIFQALKAGEGTQPTPTDKVKVHYKTVLIDGKEMESTYKNAQPAELPLSEAVKCLSEGLQMMKPGGRSKLICPSEIALGNEGNGIVPPDATLVFDVELIEVLKQAN